MTVGRNDICPCGSGKKYKKCCLTLPPLEPDTAQSPEELLRQRFHAARQGDFGFIYDTTHEESTLRQSFPSRGEYVLFGQQQLLQSFHVVGCRAIDQRQVDESTVEMTFWMATETDEGLQELFELGRFVRTPEGWRYHSGQKMTREDYTGEIDDLSFADFDAVGQKIIY